METAELKMIGRRWTALSFAAVMGLSIIGNAGPQVSRALEAMDFMLYEEAVSLFDQALAKDPTQAGVRVKQAYAYFRLNRIEKAAEVLDTELGARPDDLASLILQSFLQYKRGRLDDAEKTALAFQAALENVRKTTRANKRDGVMRDLFPNAGLPAYILGLKAKKKGDAKAARTWLIRAESLGYDPAACWIQAIDAEIGRGDFAEAMRLSRAGGDLSPVVEAAPSPRPVGMPAPIYRDGEKKVPMKMSAEIHILMGIILEEMGKPEESLENLKTAVALKPFEANAVRNLALSYFNRKEAERAGRFFGRVIKLNPGDVQAQGLWEKVRDGRRIPEDIPRLPLSRDFVEAIGVRYHYVFKSDPDAIAEKVNNYALTMIKSGLVSDAVRWLQAFVEMYENSPTIFYNLGQLYNSLDRKADALKYGLKAVELKKDYREAYDLAANVLFKIGDFESAVKYYEEVVRLDTGDPVSFFNLGCASSETGDLEKAEENWLTAVRLERALPAGREGARRGDLDVAVNVKVEPISAPACQALGLLYTRQGKIDEALAFFLRAIEFNPRAPLLYFEVGKILQERSDTLKAKEYFDKYLALGGDEAKIKVLRKK